jgi:hypothetical protein
MFEHLPDAAQAVICPLASTSSCPAHVLLARVSKLWGAAALKHFRHDGGSIALQLSCTPHSPSGDKLRELERLEALYVWLQRQGQAVTSFSIQTSSFQDRASKYVSGRSFGVSSILEALAAAGQRPGGLRLQQLQVPAIGVATPRALTQVLSGCQHLRQLQLEPNCGIGDMGMCAYLDKGLCMALQQLTQLTGLKLYASGVVDRRITGDSFPIFPMDGLVQCLPSSLQVLHMDFCCSCSLSTSSLQHLVALKQLLLPIGMGLGSSPLHPLTSVTYLDHWAAVAHDRHVLSALPNLAELRSAWCFSDILQRLQSRTALRSLTCGLDPEDEEDAAALAQLTQLTQLRLALLADEEDEGPSQLAVWGAALSLMTGLRSLALQPEVLQHVDLAALTALTRMEVLSVALDTTMKRSFDQLGAQLGCLAPACGRLREVVLLGVPAAQQEVCRAAVAAAVGDVPLLLRENCGRRVWCVCCSRE